MLPAGGHGCTPQQMLSWSTCPTIVQGSVGKERMVGVGGGRPDGQAEKAVRGDCLVLIEILDEDLQNPTHLQLQPFSKVPIVL